MLGIAGCVTTPAPKLQYALAREAYDSARSVDAGRHSQGLFHRGEESYRLGQAAYEEREFSKARDLFEKAQKDFERAENTARLIRFQTGEIL